VLRDGLVPSLPPGGAGWKAIVAILGTTISPFLFFWQAGQEVEEEKAEGRHSVAARRGASDREIRYRRIDVTVGTLVSNLVMFFIIVAAAQALRGHADPEAITTHDAAMALKPLAGDYAPWIYAAVSSVPACWPCRPWRARPRTDSPRPSAGVTAWTCPSIAPAPSMRCS
jgi:Mn2+/Fe2+ NRAMP family transporter